MSRKRSKRSGNLLLWAVAALVIWLIIMGYFSPPEGIKP